MPVRDKPWPLGTPCWVDLAVPDIPVALDFYSRVMGWTFSDTGGEYGTYQVCGVDGRAAAGIGEPRTEDQPVMWTVFLAAEQLDTTVRSVQDNGGLLLVEPMTIENVCRLAVAADNTDGTFGIWQPAPEIGIQIYNEPGALIWEDARLSDIEAGKRFYASVFDYTYQPLEGAPEGYCTFSVRGEVAGGMGGMMGAPPPSHWVPYFSVHDVDEALEAARVGGGDVSVPPEDTPFGRLAIVVDPFGAAFALHGPEGSNRPDGSNAES